MTKQALFVSAALALSVTSTVSLDAQPLTVEYTRGDLQQLPRWVLSDPIVSVGLVDGPAEYLFDHPGAIQSLGAGAFTVIDWGSAQVRTYDHDGRYLRSFGGRGSGPGELQQPTKLFRLGADSLATWDVAQARGPIYSTVHGYGRQLSLPDGITQGFLVGVFEDASFLFASLGYGASPEGDERWAEYGLFHVSRDGEVLDSIGGFRGSTLVLSEELGYWTNPAFAPQGYAAASSTAVWIADGGDPELQRVNREGKVEVKIIWDPGDRAVSDAVREAYWRQAAERGMSAEEISRRQRYLPILDELPATGQVLADRDGRVWVQREQVPLEPQRWIVFAQDGTMLALLETPATFSLRDVHGDWAFGVTRDEWGVESVERRAIRSAG